MPRTLFFHAPEFFPPLDFFFGLLNSDVWVVFDHVIFTSRSRQSRCRIRRSGGGVQQVAVSVKRPQDKPIYATVIECMHPWRRYFLKVLKLYYGDTPFFSRYYPDVIRIINSPHVLLETLNLECILYVSNLIGKQVEYCRTSEIETAKRGRYTPKYPIAKLIPLMLERYNAVPFKEPFRHPIYPQKESPFEKDLSVLDALFSIGAKNLRLLLKG